MNKLLGGLVVYSVMFVSLGFIESTYWAVESFEQQIEETIRNRLSSLSLQEQLSKISFVEDKLSKIEWTPLYVAYKDIFTTVSSTLLAQEVEVLWLLLEDKQVSLNDTDSSETFWSALDWFFDSSWTQLQSNKIEPVFSTDSLEKISDISSILRDEYVTPSDFQREKMEENAIRWYVDALWDPYTTYLSPQEKVNYDESSAWSIEFQWIWAVVGKKFDWLLVEEVLKGSPAYSAWLKQLDTILEIDGVLTKDMSLFEWVDLLRGEGWTPVTVTVYQYQTNEITEITIIRWEIYVGSVDFSLVETSIWWILHLTISTFWDDVTSLLEEYFENNSASIDHIVLDLRWNGWWDLIIATEVASFFLPRWNLVTSVDYTAFQDESYYSIWYPYVQWVPLVVLIDDWSASASELVSGAVRDTRWAWLIWDKTFWKWSIQTLRNLADWSSLKYTIGKRYTPWWYSIDEIWLSPDILIPFDLEWYQLDDSDNQLEAAFTYLWNNQ